MRIAFIGQQEFGKAALRAFIDRGDQVAGVFCMPEKPGAKPDALREAAQALGLPVFQYQSLRSSAACAVLLISNIVFAGPLADRLEPDVNRPEILCPRGVVADRY